MDAPFEMEPIAVEQQVVTNEQAEVSAPIRRWYSASDDKCTYYGWDTSVAHIFQVLPQYDVLLGFSQGACMAMMIAYINQLLHEQAQSLQVLFPQATAIHHLTQAVPQLKRIIMIGGFAPRCNEWKHVLNSMCITTTEPSIHIFGNKDQIISKQMSEEAAKHFVNRVLVEHDFGHVIPSAAPFVKQLKQYLKQQ